MHSGARLPIGWLVPHPTVRWAEAVNLGLDVAAAIDGIKEAV
jgi:hypothetical protein